MRSMNVGRLFEASTGKLQWVGFDAGAMRSTVSETPAVRKLSRSSCSVFLPFPAVGKSRMNDAMDRWLTLRETFHAEIRFTP
jgi:hypothetical protein